MLSLVSPAHSSSLALLRVFFPSIPFPSDGCKSPWFRLNGRLSLVGRLRLSAAFFSLHPSLPGRKQQFSDPEDEDAVEEDEEDDEDVAAEEYVDGVLASWAVSEDVDVCAESEGEEVEVQPSALPSSQYKDDKWQRVERLITEVREFGEDIIDFDELAGVYDFPIDKFQLYDIDALALEIVKTMPRHQEDSITTLGSMRLHQKNREASASTLQH